MYARQRQWQNAARDLHEAVSIAADSTFETAATASVVASYAYVLRKTHQRREARDVERRLAALAGARHISSLVDVSELR